MSTRHHASVVVHGHTIAYSTIGDGPPLMLIPGGLMSSERWIETGYVDLLSADFTLVLIDPLGHGESEKVADRAAYERDLLTDHLVSVVDALGLDSVAAWGYSRGAQMLGAATLHSPERFTHAVLGGTPLFDAEAVLRELGMARDEAEYDDAFTKSAAGDWDAFWSVFPVPIPDGTKRMMEARNDPAAITAAIWAARSEPFVFAPSRVPTLACWGDGEIFHELNVSTAEALGNAVQTAHLVGGHAEAFAEAQAAVDVVVPFLTSGS